MKKLNIIYEDREIIVVNKPAKLLTISTKDEQERTLYHEVYTYLHKKNQKVFVVHRLDKDTSGLVLFAKSEDIKRMLQEYWFDVDREYTAIVEGKITPDKQTIKSYLAESKTLQTYISDKEHGKLALTSYETIQSNKAFSLLKIKIKTGRKNQIRCQLASIGYPIIGDKKYHAHANPLGRLGLHASSLKFTHPKTHHPYNFECQAPNIFNNLFNPNEKSKP